MRLSKIQEKAIVLFDLDIKRASSKGWILTEKACPFCGKDSKHMGIRLNIDRGGKYKNHLVFSCFKCQEKGSEVKLFKQLGLDSFLDDIKYIKQDSNLKLENRIRKVRKESSEIDIIAIEKTLPIGYRRVSSDAYLDSRGFVQWQYDTYNVGRVSFGGKLKDYVIFSIEDEGINRGYVARHIWDKEKIKSHEKATGNIVLRYANESGVDFEKLLFGIDEVVEGKTKTAILVEGVFDKTNVDKQLGLNLSDEIKCLATFGKKLSSAQIEKLRLKGIENIILLYDNDAVNESKKYSDMLKAAFNKIKVCFIHPDCKEDPGDFDADTLVDIIMKAEDPLNYSMHKIQKRKLIQ